MRTLISCALLLLTVTAMAQSTLPKGCRPLTVQSDSLTIKAENPKLIFIHNLAESELWITHPASNAGASAGWSSRLQTKNWSGLVINKGPFILDCIESRPGHEQQIPCKGAVAACEWTKSKIPNEFKGDFWAGEDMSLAALMAELGTRGIKPK
ncbi:MAG: hypothetical protein WC627_07970 [Legionella sp.]|jgi:hypothetical protein